MKFGFVTKKVSAQLENEINGIMKKYADDPVVKRVSEIKTKYAEIFAK